MDAGQQGQVEPEIMTDHERQNLARYIFETLYRLVFRRRLKAARRRWERRHRKQLAEYKHSWAAGHRRKVRGYARKHRAKWTRRKYMRDYMAARNSKRRAAGLCARCGETSLKWFCSACVEKINAKCEE